MNLMTHPMQAALFDLDGVVIDTESQYSTFWGAMGRDYLPQEPNFSNLIKGQTLTQIYARWFCGREDLQAEITERLNAFEQQMEYPYIKGVQQFVLRLRQAGIPTAIVTSSNDAKMRNVYGQHPDFPTLFDHILTSEDFPASKPDPACYLIGAERCGAQPSASVVFEDSLNGLRAARASGAFVVGLSTTLPPSAIAPLANLVVADFSAPELLNKLTSC